MIMKTLFKIVLLVTLFFGVTSCEDFLSVKPANFYSTENFFYSTDKLRMAVNSVYTTFSCQMTYGQYWMVYDCDTDISFIQGTNLGHVARDLGHYNCT